MGKIEKAQHGFHSILQGFLLTLREKRTLFRSILIGLGIGILPAAGAIIATTISYGQARRSSKHPERFGHGEVAGVVAAESADNASEPGSMATMMCLGIPGGAATAIIIAAFMYHGMSPGPYLIRDHLDFAYAIILANFLQVFLMLGLGILFCYYTGWIVFVPTRLLVPIITVITFGGILALRGQMIDLWIAIIFGGVGYILKKYDYPILAFIIGFILGGKVEEQFVRTKLLFANEYHLLLYRPIFVVFLLGTVGSFLLPPLIRYFKKTRKTELI
jgi:putative tricarboxylic transport membrane protein